MRGGIITKDRAMATLDAFNSFLDNSICTIITIQSAGGLLFKLTLNPDIESPFILNRSNTPLAEVRGLIIKLVFINETGGRYAIFNGPTQLTRLSDTTQNEFLSECGIQDHVFTKTLDEYLEPICPCILMKNPKLSMFNFFKIHEAVIRSGNKNAKFIFDKIAGSVVLTQSPSDLTVGHKGETFDIGLIVMEHLEGFDTLYNINKTSVTPDFNKMLVIFELYKLFNLRLLHGDFHQSNFMINPTYEYIDGRLGRAIIIDFGASFMHQYPPIDDSNMMQVVDYNFLTDVPIFAVGEVATNPVYQWLRVPLQDYTAWNAELKLISDARDVKKAEFLAHVSSAVTSGTAIGGRRVQTMRVQPIKDTYAILNKYNVFNKHSAINKYNIFNKLDPDNVFTRAFIKNYIHDELRNIKATGLGVKKRKMSRRLKRARFIRRTKYNKKKQ